MSPRGETLAAVRGHAKTEPVRLVLELIQSRADALAEELVTADPARVRSLQGAVAELRDLHNAISAEPRKKQHKDGAYA
jgi:hypothetical protein